VTAAVVTSRRVSAGIRPDAGATSRLPSWWGAEDWSAEVAEALTADVCREHRVDPETAHKVARGMAAYADHRTGRGCRPTNARLVEDLRLSLSTVQRARRALKALGLVVELVRGRSIMTRAERLEAWRRGSAHRQVAAEFALCSRRRSAPRMRAPEVGEPLNDLGAPVHSVDGDTPPGAKRVKRFSHLRSTHLRRRTETRNAAPRRAPAKEGRERKGAGVDVGAWLLAQAVQRRVSWLRGVSARRTAPALGKFARAGWTAEDVQLGIRDVLAVRGHVVPAELRHPAAYLAGLLRDLDPADRPTVLEDAFRAAEAAERHFHDHLRVFGAPCPHGEPAGDVPTPLRGLILCPACRRGAGA
jgi:hypothetical protein